MAYRSPGPLSRHEKGLRSCRRLRRQRENPSFRPPRQRTLNFAKNHIRYQEKRMSLNLSKSHWTPIGPAPVDTSGGLGATAGRIEAAVSDPGDSSVIYAAASGGGVWKTTGNNSWTPLTDDMPSLSFGGYHPLVVHPANHNLILG